MQHVRTELRKRILQCNTKRCKLKCYFSIYVKNNELAFPFRLNYNIIVQFIFSNILKNNIYTYVRKYVTNNI